LRQSTIFIYIGLIICIFIFQRKLGFRNKKGIERNLLAKKFIQKILYSKQSVKIALFYSVRKPISDRVYAGNPKDFQKLSSQSNTALLSQDGAKNFSKTRVNSCFKDIEIITSPTASGKQQFVINSTSGRNNEFQTFNIILPNLIHKSKKKNLKR